MHILMATVDALEISTDDLVLNRTSLQRMRESNRHYESDDAKSELVDKVMTLNLSSSYLKYIVYFCFFVFVCTIAT